MSTKDGKMITTDSKPKLDESTGMYRYYDAEGREVMIKQDDVTQIMELNYQMLLRVILYVKHHLLSISSLNYCSI